MVFYQINHEDYSFVRLDRLNCDIITDGSWLCVKYSETEL